MKYVDRRKGPKMKFIVPDHRVEFENDIIDIYAKSEGGFWGCIPSLEVNIIPFIHQKHILAGLTGKVTGNPSWFTQHTEGKLIPELHDIWSAAQLEKFIQDGYIADIQKSYASAESDAMAVLDFHRMFYAFEVPQGTVFRNAPWKTFVW